MNRQEKTSEDNSLQINETHKKKNNNKQIGQKGHEGKRKEEEGIFLYSD
jgi:hypothetical protein